MQYLRRCLSGKVSRYLPNNISHQEEEGFLGRGAEVLAIYCYLLVKIKKKTGLFKMYKQNKFLKSQTNSLLV